MTGAAPAAAGAWSASAYAANARFASELGAEVLALLAPQPGERILDPGCGDGALSLRIAAAGGPMTGVDSPPDMPRAARATGIDAIEGRAEALGEALASEAGARDDLSSVRIFPTEQAQTARRERAR